MNACMNWTLSESSRRENVGADSRCLKGNIQLTFVNKSKPGRVLRAAACHLQLATVKEGICLQLQQQDLSVKSNEPAVSEPFI